jgi:maltooligosyltrehalose trehalohydrolase
MLGAWLEGDGTAHFRVWAPRPRRLQVELLDPAGSGGQGGHVAALFPTGNGYFEARLAGVAAGTRYFYLVDGERRPDPASRSQPEGVHGASEVVAPPPIARPPRPKVAADALVFYELHVGAFTPEGTFDAAAARVERLVALGVTAVELMPVASFPGARNWGYDGVGWFAPHAGYGGPAGLRRLVEVCHHAGAQLFVDVVYNHLGPEGNYLEAFGPYARAGGTRWGDALDLQRPAVQAHVLAHAAMLFDEYDVDGLRLDAVHAYVEDSRAQMVRALCELAHARGRRVVAESDLGEACVVEPPPDGWQCDAVWADDLHHALHATLTGETRGYYLDYGPDELQRAIAEGFGYTGQRSRVRGRRHGTPSSHLPGARFVACAQNHDQVGNRPCGERLGHLVPEAAHAAAAVVLCAPALPLLFMGEEHADPAPFFYFTDFSDPAVGRAVAEGRAREHGPGGPDPQAEDTFLRSRIDLALGRRGAGAALREFYRALLSLRRERSSLARLDHARAGASVVDGVLLVRRLGDAEETLLVASLCAQPARVALPRPRGTPFAVLLDAGDHGGARGAALLLDEAVLPGYGVLVLGSDR